MTEQNTLSISELQQQADAKAAEINAAEAQYRLALCYFEGKGVKKSYEYGMKSMIAATAQGYAEAIYWLTNAYISLAIPSCFLDKSHVEKYYKFVSDWCKKEIDGHIATEAWLMLGILSFSGKGIEQNNEYALECFQHAHEALNNSYDFDHNDYIEDLICFYRLCCKAKINGTQDIGKLGLYPPMVLELGQILVEGIKAIPHRKLDKNRIFLILLQIAIYKEAGGYEQAKTFAEEAFDRPTDQHLKEVCLINIAQEQELSEKNKRLEDSNHRMQRLVEQFTHSLGNVIFPDTIYQVAERLKNNSECRKDVLLLHEAYHSEIIIKLQGELLRQRYANTNPEKFRQFIRSCRRTPNSAENTKSIEDILDYAASRVTARFLNQHYAGLNSIRDRILSKKNVRLNALKQKFEDDILLNKSLRPIAWINENLRPVKITEISPLWKKVFILSESHAEALLFGYFSEILFNAFKYADHDKAEFLTLSFDEKIINDKTYLACSWKNPVKDKVPPMLGTGKGLDAIQEDLKQLNDTEHVEQSLLINQQDNQFQVTLFFNKDLLIDDLPILTRKKKNEK